MARVFVQLTTPRQTAAYLRLPIRTVRRMGKAGELPMYRFPRKPIGYHTRFNLTRFLDLERH